MFRGAILAICTVMCPVFGKPDAPLGISRGTRTHERTGAAGACDVFRMDWGLFGVVFFWPNKELTLLE